MPDNYVIDNDIKKLVECQSIEIQKRGSSVLIPYMMNDAVECYIELKNCIVHGDWDNSIEDGIDYELVENEGKKGVIFRCETGRVISIWYEEAEKHLKLYQYHRIGHFWVRGNEKWRRLVYIAGTIHDKLTFLGEEYCNDEEKQLAKLMGYAPFRYWSPIRESLDEYYADTEEARDFVVNILGEIIDKKLMKSADIYIRDYEIRGRDEKTIKKAAKELSESQELYNYLNKLVIKASIQWRPRKYPAVDEQLYEFMRTMVVEEYLDQGYTGTYPVLTKENSKVIFYEEHPFVVREFEYEDYDFKIKAMME